jgi:hypothetical protein
MFIARLGTGRTSPAYIHLSMEEMHGKGLDSLGWHKLIGSPSVEMLNGKDAGAVSPDDEGNVTLRAIGHYKLSFGHIKAPKYPLLLSFNPALAEVGQVTMPTTMVLPGEEMELMLVLSTFKQASLGDLKWMIQAAVTRVVG